MKLNSFIHTFSILFSLNCFKNVREETWNSDFPIENTNQIKDDIYKADDSKEESVNDDVIVIHEHHHHHHHQTEDDQCKDRASTACDCSHKENIGSLLTNPLVQEMLTQYILLLLFQTNFLDEYIETRRLLSCNPEAITNRKYEIPLHDNK